MYTEEYILTYDALVQFGDGNHANTFHQNNRCSAWRWCIRVRILNAPPGVTCIQKSFLFFYFGISVTTQYFYSSPASLKLFAPTTSLPPKHLTHTTVSSFTTSSLRCRHFWARKIKPPSERGVRSFFCTSHIAFLPLFAHPSCRLPTGLQDHRFRSRVRRTAHDRD